MIPGETTFADPVLGDQAYGGGPSGYADFLQNTARRGVYLADIRYRLREDADAQVNLRVMAEPVFADPPDGGYATGPSETLFLSSATWIGKGNDIRRRHVPARPRLRTAINATRRYPFFPDESRAAQSTSGFLEIANNDSEFDWLPASMTVDGIEQTVRFGPRHGSFDDFDVRLSAIGRRLTGRRNRVRVELQENENLLSQSITAAYYSGQGGPEGDAELAGQPVQTIFGNCFNVSMRRISRPFEVWQVGVGPLHKINAVYERAAGMTVIADVPDWDALIQLEIPPFTCAICSSGGFVRFGTPPVGIVTADVQGFVFNGAYLQTLEQVGLYLLRYRAGLSANAIDRASFFQLGEQEIGYATGSNDLTCSDYFEEAARSIVGFHGRGLDGRYRMRRVIAPERLSAPVPIPVAGNDIQIETAPTYVRSKQRVFYRRNWTIMGDADISPSVSDTRRAEVKMRGLYVDVDNGSALSGYATAKPGDDIDTIFVQRDPAQEVARTNIELFGHERDIITAPVGRLGFALDGGDPVMFQTDRYGAHGKVFIVREIQEKSDGEQLTIRTFGSAQRMGSS